MLSVDETGQVQFDGRAVLNGNGLTWSAAQVKTQVDLKSRDLGDIVLVNAWLTGVDFPAPCLTFPPTFPGLPDRNECGRRSWIADEAAVMNPSFEEVPVSAIEIQPAAFDAFAPDPAARAENNFLKPQRAVYALARRLYGQFCASESPCWDWSVVGRLSQAAPIVAPPSVDYLQTSGVQPTPTADTQTTTPPPTPNAVSCTGDVTLTDTTGQVLACSDAGGRDYHSQDAHISVDPALPSRLNIWWGQSTCAVSYEINVSAAPADLPQPADYQIEVLSQNGPSSDCMPDAHAATIDFGSPVDATRVRLVINDQRLADPVACVPAPGLVDGGDGVNIYDSTDLITSCTQRQPTTDSAELVSNLTESSIVVRWKDRPCGVPIHLMFDSVSRSNGFVLSKPGQCMVTSLMTYEIVVNFTQSISASSIDASSLPSSN